MNRRNFFATTITATAGLSACGRMVSENDQPGPGRFRNRFAPKQKPILLKTVSNEYLSVRVFSNALLQVDDLKNKASWESWPLAIQDKSVIEEGEVWINTDRSQTEQYPGRFMGIEEGRGIRFTLLGRNNLIIGTFLCEIILENQWLVFKTSDIDDSIPSLVFPPPFKSDEIVIPKGVGEIIRKKERGTMFSRYIYPFYTRLNMRWMGGLKNGNGWIGIFDEGFEDAFGFVANRTAAPLMTRSLDRWSHDYTWRMQFVKGNYVELAKVFRKWVIDNGRFVSLSDKIASNKNLLSLLGGRIFWINLAFPSENVSQNEDLYGSVDDSDGSNVENQVRLLFTYAGLKEFIERIRKLGLKKGLIKIGGWINGGYDYSHPDVWPPEPGLGEISELKNILHSDDQLITGLHDNNQDMYQHSSSFPDGVNMNADGSMLTGGIWAGGQAYIINSRKSVEYARRNWEKIKTLDPKAMFIDIVTAMQLYQSFDPLNKTTKKQDLEEKINLLRFYKEQGVLLGSEEAADFGIPYIDWFENRHQRIAGQSIPLWPLVFHDAAFCTRYFGVSQNDEYPGYLLDMLWGYIPHFRINPGWDEEALFKSLSHVDQWHERIGTSEMTNHRFLSDDFSVEETTFSSGDRIVCNFGKNSFLFEGKEIRPHGYLLLKS